MVPKPLGEHQKQRKSVYRCQATATYSLSYETTVSLIIPDPLEKLEERHVLKYSSARAVVSEGIHLGHFLTGLDPVKK
jgi:hypothetical protein